MPKHTSDLLPIFETSILAKFMIPMAISLGYGILVAIAISLLLVPCLYLMFGGDIPKVLSALKNTVKSIAGSS